MAIQVTDVETGENKIIDTAFTLRQYVLINCCGFFKAVKMGKAWVLVDPITQQALYELKAVQNV